jgi:hypothetical protein
MNPWAHEPEHLQDAAPEQHLLAAHVVDQRHVERADGERGRQEPDRLQRVVRAVGRVADGFEDVGEEEPVRARHQVPDAVHHDQERQGAGAAEELLERAGGGARALLRGATQDAATADRY